MTLRSGEIYVTEQNSSYIIPETISLFGLTISFYGLLLVVAALIGIIVISEATRRKKQNTEWNLTLITLLILSALLGGRLYYVLFEWEKFMAEPWALINLRSGGLSYFGALFGAWSTIKLYCRKKDGDFLQSADTLCLGAAAAAPWIWCGCAFVREPLGKFYDGLFAVRIGAEYIGEATERAGVVQMQRISGKQYISVHPVAVYGIVFSVLIFVLLCVYMFYVKREGAVFTAYLVMNSVAMAVLEAFRADSYYVWGTTIPVNYIVSGVILFTIAFTWIRRLIPAKRSKRKVFMES
jgi:phosphatidylglycerol:prolipoprotein diacylglycerol transferase